MRRVLLLGLVLGLVPLLGRADEPDPEPPVADRNDLMRGKWELTAIELGGMKIPLAGLGAKGVMTLKFEKTSVTTTAQGMTKSGSWKIDPRKKPKQIDLISRDDGKKSQGIYKLEKDELTIALAEDGKPRPKDFKDNKAPVIVLKRVAK